MREIKFRGKRLDNGEWIYGYLWIIPGVNLHYILTGKINIRDCSIEKYEVDPETVGQYTGLKDKNGTEIYDGNILSVIEVSDLGTSEYKSPVEYIDCGFLVTEPNGTQTPLACFVNPNSGYPLYEIEVIGNVVEYPHLLKEA